MNSNKCKIWDNEKKDWFTPTYPSQKGGGVPHTDTQEILISQAGEIYLHEQKRQVIDTDPNTKPELVTFITHFPQGTPDEPGRFVICNYTGHRDVNGIKWYVDDIVKDPNGKVGVLTWYDDRLAVGMGHNPSNKDEPFDSYHFITSMRLRSCENIGNINKDAL